MKSYRYNYKSAIRKAYGTPTTYRQGAESCTLDLSRLTDEQSAIVDYAKTGVQPGSRMVVPSGAGSGKTSTAIAFMQSLSNAGHRGPNACVAFASRNKKDFDAKFSHQDWLVKTLTGLGLYFAVKAWGRLQLDYNADRNRLLQVCPELREEKQALFMAHKLMGYIQSTCVGIPNKEMMMKLAISQDCECDQKRQAMGWNTENLCDITTKALHLCLVRPNDGGFTFGNMNWVAVAAGLVKRTFRYILTDEAQDTNALSKEMTQQALLSDGSEGFFGDDNQAIYGFRGSLFNAMATFAKEKPSQVFKLSQSFRCGKAIVRQANKLVTDYYAHPSNPEGEVIASEDSEAMVKRAMPGDCIESRTNAPLMPYCLDFIKAGKPANVEGKDIGYGLIQTIESVGGNTVTDFLVRLEDTTAAKVAKMGTGWNSAQAIAKIQDDASCLRTLAENTDSIPAMIGKIKSIFTDAEDRRVPVITLSTVHKAKGLEWSKVSILAETFAGNRAVTPEQVQEERNIQYVAWTRAKTRLAFVYGASNGGTGASTPAKSAVKQPQTPA